MSTTDQLILCAEITEQGSYHRHLVMNSFSGGDLLFRYNLATDSYLRAYRNPNEYLQDRSDLHYPGVWTVMVNLIPESLIDPECFDVVDMNRPAPAEVKIAIDSVLRMGPDIPEKETPKKTPVRKEPAKGPAKEPAKEAHKESVKHEVKK